MGQRINDNVSFILGAGEMKKNKTMDYKKSR